MQKQKGNDSHRPFSLFKISRSTIHFSFFILGPLIPAEKKQNASRKNKRYEYPQQHRIPYIPYRIRKIRRCKNSFSIEFLIYRPKFPEYLPLCGKRTARRPGWFLPVILPGHGLQLFQPDIRIGQFIRRFFPLF